MNYHSENAVTSHPKYILQSIQIQIIANKTVLCKDGSGNWEKANCNYMQTFR